MRKSRFTDGQVVAILREANCSSVAQVAREHKVSEQHIYSWRKQAANWRPNLRRLHALESENAKLKRLLFERDYDIRALREVNSRAAVDLMMLTHANKCNSV